MDTNELKNNLIANLTAAYAVYTESLKNIEVLSWTSTHKTFQIWKTWPYLDSHEDCDWLYDQWKIVVDTPGEKYPKDSAHDLLEVSKNMKTHLKPCDDILDSLEGEISDSEFKMLEHMVETIKCHEGDCWKAGSFILRQQKEDGSFWK